MSCTRVLHAFSSPQPVDLAMQLTISQRQPLYQLLAMSPLKPSQRFWRSADYPQRTSFHSQPIVSTAASTLAPPPPTTTAAGPRQSCLRKYTPTGNKKRVVFADTKGLALTAVRLFISEPNDFTTSPAMRLFSNKPQRQRWRLGFPQQLQDIKTLPERLRDTHVQLEGCNLSQHSLSGRVFSSHASTEPSVHIRLTFDSWRNHHDIPCSFSQHQHHGGSVVDLFTFDLGLPQHVDPQERVEFCVSFRPSCDSTQYWDNNRGQNYKLYVEKEEPTVNQPCRQFNYPSLSKHRLSWPSKMAAGLQHATDTLHVQRSLSSANKA